MAYRVTGELRLPARCARIAAVLMILALALAGCSGDEEADAPVVDLLATSGSYSATVRPDNETQVPLSDVIYITAEFENKIYGLAGQTAVKMTADPPSYHLEQVRAPDLQTYRVALIRPAPGKVTLRLYENAQAKPIEFTLVIEADDATD